MDDWRNGMVTPADRAEKSAEKMMHRLDQIDNDLQQYRNETQKQTNRANTIGILAFLVGIATLIVSFLNYLK